MKKSYLLLLSVLCISLSGIAQSQITPKTFGEKTVVDVFKNKKDFTKKPEFKNDKAISCLDTSFYAAYKNNAGPSAFYQNYIGNFDGGAQTYHYTGSGEIVGLLFYTVHDFSGTPGDLPDIPMDFKVYNVDGTNTPTTAIRTETGTISDVGFAYQSYMFNSPVPVSNNFAVALELGAAATSADTFFIVSNGNGDGRGEDLSKPYASGFGGYYSSLVDFAVDHDFYIFPIIQHNVNASFTADKVCLNVGETINLTNNSTWIAETDSMFNILGIVGGSNYGWDFGDGTNSSAMSPSHSYASAGGYTITLVDSLFTWTGACFEGAQVRVSVGLSGSVSGSTDPNCNGGSDGTITLSQTGGISPYTYSDDGTTFGSTNPLTGFNAGSHSVYVQDSLGCVDTINTSLSEPTAVTINSQSSTPASCGGSDGTITFSATGGTGTITYSLDGTNYQGSGSFTGLTATTYTLYARDVNGCVGTSTETVTNSGAPSISSLTSSPVSCNGGSDGSITVSGTGGTGTLEYSIDGVNFYTTTTFTSLTSGTYTVTVRDGVGCTASQNINVSQPAPITANAGSDQTVCADNATINLSGTITVASGYSWTTSGTGSFSAASSQNTSYTPSAGDIASGSITITLTTTGNGSCTAATDDMTLTINPAPTVDAGMDITVCENNASTTLSGSFTVASGVSWSSSNGSATFGNVNSATSSYTSTTPGTDVLVLTTTGNGLCSAVTDTVLVTITPAPTVDAGAIGAACAGDTIPLNGVVTVASGGVWTSSGSGTFTNSSSLTTSYVASDSDGVNGSVSFTLTSTGNGNCLAESDGLFYFVDPAPVVDLGPDTTLCSDSILTINVGLGSDYSYLWSSGEQTEIIDITSGGTYEVTVTDTNTCTGTDAIVVTFISCGDTSNNDTTNNDTTGNTNSIYEGQISWVKIYPNPTNGVVSLQADLNESATIEVINVLGETVISRSYGATQVNSQIDLSDQENGTYFFRITKGKEVITEKIQLVR